MNYYRFYRLDFCLRNLGLGLMALLTLEALPGIFPASLAIFQILLVQMQSFSANNYFDSFIWGEDNYISELVREGVSKKRIVFLLFLPVLILMLTLPFSDKSFMILILYMFLFSLYQLPGVRKVFKEHYLPSIIINSICLGTILYLYPFIFLSGGITFTALIFSLIFFFYMSFHEVVHQIAHMGDDRIYSLPQAAGIPGASRIGVGFLVLAASAAAWALIRDPSRYFFFTVTVIFSLVRILKLFRIKPERESFSKIRNSADKFYSFQEGACYAALLVLRHILP